METEKLKENALISLKRVAIALGGAVIANALIFGGLYAFAPKEEPPIPTVPFKPECPKVPQEITDRVAAALNPTAVADNKAWLVAHREEIKNNRESLRAAEFGLEVQPPSVTEKAFWHIYNAPTVEQSAARLNTYSTKYYGVGVSLADAALHDAYLNAAGIEIDNFPKAATKNDRMLQHGQIASVVYTFQDFPREQIEASGLKEIAISGNIRYSDGRGIGGFAEGARIVMPLGQNVLAHELGHKIDKAFCQGTENDDKEYTKLNPPTFRYDQKTGQDPNVPIPPQTWQAVSERYSIASAVENKGNNIANIMRGEINCGPPAERQKRQLMTARLEALQPNLGLYWASMNTDECPK